MAANGITIRTLRTIEEYGIAEETQARIWGMPDMTRVVSVDVMITAQKNGGLVCAAFDEQQNMIGVLFGFLGFAHGNHLKHCSHIMGVLPGIRRQSVGEALKLFQCDYVMAQGIDLITWTYDPLEGVNASLNIAKLGAIDRTYYVNAYGNMRDSLNNGLRSDRFEVEWWIRSKHARQYIAGDRAQRPGRRGLMERGAVLANDLRLNDQGLPVPQRINNTGHAPTVLIEIPADFQAIKANDRELAVQWREHSAALFGDYFGKGYAVIDFLTERPDPDGQRRNFYVLSNDVESRLME